MTLQLLLAEDDPQLREVLIEALTLESFAVTACDNAEDALDIAAKQPFDLALFDVVMGGMTGIDALTTLR
ncbi:response regulator, partial [Vibrio fluvialis]